MLNLKVNLMKNEVLVNRQGSGEEIRLFLGNPGAMPGGQVKIDLDLPKIYSALRDTINCSDRAYTPYSIREGGNPLVFCKKDSLWTPDSYEIGISNLVLDPEEISILYLGKRGKVGRDIRVNVFAPEFEVLPYEILQDPDALKFEETKQLRNIVDHKILEKLRRAA